MLAVWSGRPRSRLPAAGRSRAGPPAHRSPGRSPAGRSAAGHNPAGSRNRGGQARGIPVRGTRAAGRSRRKPGRPWAAGRRRERCAGLRRPDPNNPDRRSRCRPWPAASTRSRRRGPEDDGRNRGLPGRTGQSHGPGCRSRLTGIHPSRNRTRAGAGIRSPAAGSHWARRCPGQTASDRIRLFPAAVRCAAPARRGPVRWWAHPRRDAAQMAIHRRQPANRFSYTGSLPCLSYSRSMITSIIATKETLCGLLG